MLRKIEALSGPLSASAAGWVDPSPTAAAASVGLVLLLFFLLAPAISLFALTLLLLEALPFFLMRGMVFGDSR
jgi:hypothetical protein